MWLIIISTFNELWNIDESFAPRSLTRVLERLVRPVTKLSNKKSMLIVNQNPSKDADTKLRTQFTEGGGGRLTISLPSMCWLRGLAAIFPSLCIVSCMRHTRERYISSPHCNVPNGNSPRYVRNAKLYRSRGIKV